MSIKENNLISPPPIKLKYSKHFRVSFTLAEVLITLGIIGVVAALTLPTVVQSYKKKVVETRMAKFYTTFNEAIKLSEAVNGNFMDWEFPVNPDEATAQAWFDKYFRPYIKILKTDTLSTKEGGRSVVWLPDGSLVVISSSSTWLFFPNSKDYITTCNDETQNCYPKEANGGTIWFTFVFAPKTKENETYYKKGLEPYCHANFEVTADNLLNPAKLQACTPERSNEEHALCAKLIQINGWKIPDNYPFKF